MRSRNFAAALAAGTYIVAFATPAVAQAREYNIPAGSLKVALDAYVRQSGRQIVYRVDEVRTARSPGVKGPRSADSALAALLSTSGFTTRTDGDLVAVVKSGNERAGVDGQDRSDDASSTGMMSSNDIVVTAQKREERAGDVPASVSVVNPKILSRSGKSRLQDYFSQVPGLSLTTGSFGGGGTQYPTIRGLSAGLVQNATVATVIDDIPIGSIIQQNAGGATQPDLDPSDLARIEVLKGPQGVLYGAASLGGLIKFVTSDPSTSGFSGRGEISGSAVSHGGWGYAARGAVNVPLSPTLAVRASAFKRRDPGYIDNLTTGENNFNTADTSGGRVSLLWKPADNFRIKLAALIQQVSGSVSFVNSNRAGGFPEGDLNFTRLPGAEKYKARTELYTAVADWGVGGVDITSLTAFSTNLSLSNIDLSACCAALYGTPYFPASTGALDRVRFQTNRFSQELRASSRIGKFAEWQIGAFYARQRTPNSGESLGGAIAQTGAVTGFSYLVRSTLPVEDRAIFGNVTLHVTDRVSVEVGGRQAWNRQKNILVLTGPAVPDLQAVPEPFTISGGANADAFTYRVAPKFKISEDLMVYGSASSGFRIGGPNNNAPAGAAQGIFFPSAYSPDRTTNYEVGLKGTLLDRRLTLTAALYRIDWKNFQISLIGTNGAFQQGYIANAGNARSQGFELSAEAHPWTGMALAVNGSIGRAELSENLPASSTGFGLKGDRLPYSTKQNGSVSAEQMLPLGDGWNATLGGSVNYVGSKYLEFIAASAPPNSRIKLPGYTTFDLRAGASRDGWGVNLFVNNLTDQRKLSHLRVNAALGSTGSYYASIIQPRTAGISLSKDF